MTQAFLGKGTQLQWDIGSGFQTITEVRSISGPTLEGAEVDVTNMDSPGRYREFIQGLLDAGEISFEVNYIPSNIHHKTLLSDMSALTQTTRNFRMRFAQLLPVEGFTFTGFVKSAPLNIPVDDAVRLSVVVRISGAITAYTE